ncbi:MAG: LysM peptidoglycan-binding domain-containing protein, partial [Desulfitobacterium sp.]|nr:LysM peptidoglycan-binding domain-containing protein [Desulfitobacterium sp.]
MEPENKKGIKPLLDRIHKLNIKLPFDIKRPLWKSPIVIGGALTAFLVLGGGGYYYGSTAPAAYVLVNGEEIGIVENEDKGQKLLDEILKEIGAPYGESAKTHDEITFNPVRVENNYQPLSKSALKSKLSYYIEGVEVKVGDNSLFVLPEKEDVDRLLEAYQNHFIEENETNKITSVSFEEDITLTDVEVLPEEITDFDQALAMLKEGYVQREEYVVEKNDSWWLIARKKNLLTDDVIAANPGNTIDSIIKPGDVLNIEKVSPYLTVVFEGTRTDVEVIPFDVISKTDYSLASGKTKVRKAGADGEKEVTYNYVQKNNKIVEKTVTNEKILKKPVDQVVAKGPAR